MSMNGIKRSMTAPMPVALSMLAGGLEMRAFYRFDILGVRDNATL